MNSLFSFARHKSSIINSPVSIILLLLCCIAGCRGGLVLTHSHASGADSVRPGFPPIYKEAYD